MPCASQCFLTPAYCSPFFKTKGLMPKLKTKKCVRAVMGSGDFFLRMKLYSLLLLDLIFVLTLGFSRGFELKGSLTEREINLRAPEKTQSFLSVLSADPPSAFSYVTTPTVYLFFRSCSITKCPRSIKVLSCPETPLTYVGVPKITASAFPMRSDKISTSSSI